MKERPGGVWEAPYQNCGEIDQRYRVMACSRGKREQRDRHKTVEKENSQQQVRLYGFPNQAVKRKLKSKEALLTY